MRLRAAVVLGSVMSFASAAGAQSSDDWFGRDKALHFAASAAIAGGAYAVGALWLDDTLPRALLGAGAGLAAGVGKELLDLAGYGDPSWRDLAWDVAGTGVGVLAAWALDVALRPAPSPPPATCPMPHRAGVSVRPALSLRAVGLTLSW